MARRVGGQSPAKIAQYLSGIDFPCQKEDLIEHGIVMLQNLPEGEYTNMADVMKGYGEAHRAESNEAAGNGHSARRASRRHAPLSARSGGQAQQRNEGEETAPGKRRRRGA